MDNSTASMTPSELNEKPSTAGSAQTDEFTALLNQASSEDQKQLIRRAFALGARPLPTTPQFSIERVATDAVDMLDVGSGFFSDLEALFVAIKRTGNHSEAMKLADVGSYLASTWCNDLDCEQENLKTQMGAY